MTWTDEQTAELTRLCTDGQSSGQIADAMGVTRNTVIGKCHRLGLQLHGLKSPWPDFQVTRLRAMDLNGYTHEEIGRELGVSAFAVTAKLRRMGKGPTGRRRNYAVRRPPTPPSTVKRVRRPTDAAPLNISILDLRGGQCRWVCDERDARGLATFCGCPVWAGSWCYSHARVVFNPASPMRSAA